MKTIPWARRTYSNLQSKNSDEGQAWLNDSRCLSCVLMNTVLFSIGRSMVSARMKAKASTSQAIDHRLRKWKCPDSVKSWLHITDRVTLLVRHLTQRRRRVKSSNRTWIRALGESSRKRIRLGHLIRWSRPRQSHQSNKSVRVASIQFWICLLQKRLKSST